MPRYFSFSLLIATSAALGHVYLYRRLFRLLVPGRLGRGLIIAGLTLMTGVLLWRRTGSRSLPPEWSDLFQAAVYTYVAVMMCLVLGVAAADAVKLGMALASRLELPAPPLHPERRALLTRTLPYGAIACGLTTAGYGSWRAFAKPDVSEVVVKIPRLPKTLEGFSIVQLTDIHVGAFIERRFVEQLVREANALKPDLVAITGDLVDGNVAQLGGTVSALAGLNSRFGTYFVTGNHDYYSGDDAWTAFLESIGVHVLRNRRVAIGDAGGTFDLMGVDDFTGWRRRGKKGYDLEAALSGRDPEKAAVLLAHQPANFRAAAEAGIDLQLSGHTHGGQVFPMTHLIGLRWEYVAGLYRHENAHIYVSRGCGFWGPPVRLGSRSEIVKVVLV